MKKIILSALVLAMAFAVQAQEIPDRKSEKPGMMHKKKRQDHGMELKSLNLTEDQKAKFKTENQAFRKQMEELKKNDNITVKEWKGKEEAIRKQHKENIQSILTAEQKAKMKEMRKEGKSKHEDMKKDDKAKHEDMRKDGRNNADARKGMADKMKTELGLTAEQSAKIESNNKALAEKAKAIRENNSLTTEEKREQMKELQKNRKEALKSILTAEQLQKLKDQERPKRDEMKKRTEKDIK